MPSRALTVEYWMDGGWFIGRLQSHPEISAEAETLEELHLAIGRAYELMNRPHSESLADGVLMASSRHL